MKPLHQRVRFGPLVSCYACYHLGQCCGPAGRAVAIAPSTCNFGARLGRPRRRSPRATPATIWRTRRTAERLRGQLDETPCPRALGFVSGVMLLVARNERRQFRVMRASQPLCELCFWPQRRAEFRRAAATSEPGGVPNGSRRNTRRPSLPRGPPPSRWPPPPPRPRSEADPHMKGVFYIHLVLQLLGFQQTVQPPRLDLARNERLATREVEQQTLLAHHDVEMPVVHRALPRAAGSLVGLEVRSRALKLSGVLWRHREERFGIFKLACSWLGRGGAKLPFKNANNLR